MLPALLGLVLSVTQPVVDKADGGSVVVKGQRFMAEVARTPREVTRGLMYRQSLAKDRCMFFFFEEDAHHTVWMKNCLIALDVVWAKDDGTVVELKERIPPLSPMFTGANSEAPTYGGTLSCRYFVEFPAGTIHRLGLKVGDRIGWALHLSDGQDVVGGLAVPKESSKGKGKGKGK